MIELLLSDEQSFSVEDTNLSAFLKRPVRVNGGAVFLCTAGRAVVSVNVEEHAIECDTEVVLLPDMVFMLVEASADFRVIFYASSIQVFDGAMQRLDTECFHYLETHPAIRHRGETAPRGEKPLFRGIGRQRGDGEHLPFADHVPADASYPAERLRQGPAELHPLSGGGRPSQAGTLRSLREVDRRAFHRAARRGLLCRKTLYFDELPASVTRTLTGETPKEMIDKWIVHEIKLMLMFSDLSLQQIADRMHFPDQSYLGRFFKRHTGSSPLAYRNAK